MNAHDLAEILQKDTELYPRVLLEGEKTDRLIVLIREVMNTYNKELSTNRIFLNNFLSVTNYVLLVHLNGSHKTKPLFDDDFRQKVIALPNGVVA